MEGTNKVRLLATRDFSENFDVALTFIKLNYGPVLRGICILIPILLIAVFISPNANSFSLDDISDYDNPMDIYAQIFTFGYMVAAILSGVVSFLAYVYVVAYMALYAKSENGEVKSSEVWSKVLNAILPVFIASILFGILVAIGTILCIIPGIVLYVYLGFYIYVYVNEDLGLIESFQRSYELVKGNWWVTFGFGLIFMILILLGGFIFSLPSSLSVLGTAFGMEFFTGDIFLYIAALIASLGSFILYPILYMAMGVMYFSHLNQHENYDMDSEINNIGTFNNNQNNVPY